MKKLSITLISVLFISCASMAQIPELPQPNGNIINNSLNKFEGTWMWTSGADTVKIILRKENILLPFPENSRTDYIVGFHIYKKGNVIVENSIVFQSTNYNEKHYTILGGNGSGVDINELTCTIRDISKNKSADLTLIINTTNNQLQWALKNSEGLRVGNFDWGFTLPKNIVLNKQ